MTVDEKSAEQAQVDVAGVFTGLAGVDELVSAPGLDVLRGRGKTEDLWAMLRLMRLVESEEASRKAAA